MSYVITELCIRDGACAEVCPVACIHSTKKSLENVAKACRKDVCTFPGEFKFLPTPAEAMP